MNAYPSELVVQLRPCVHVSGLVPERKAWHDVLPHPTQVHPELCQALVAQLTRHAQPQAWYPPTRPDYVRMVFVAYAHKIPPARMRAGLRLQDEQARRVLGALPPRSPLSPLYPGGPLFPDGIISPSWIRKHTEYVPGVHVAFFCMPPHDTASLAMDAALIEVVASMRAAYAQRGIKLMMVLLCDPLLFAQGIEARVAHLRRASGLEARGAVFVLNTGAKEDMAPFAQSLMQAARLVAQDYYREHARHVRRNRARYPPPPSVAQPIMRAAVSAGVARADRVPSMLSAEGWHIRMHYKLGALTELQGETHEAHQLYMEAYRLLMHTYLPNAALVEPRTRRWAEAKVLADTLSLKLVKLELYDAQRSLAHKQCQYHMSHMSQLCQRWGMTQHEYWAWLAKQYVLVTDLVGALPMRMHGFDVPLWRYQAALCYMQRACCGRPADAARREAHVDYTTPIVRELHAAYEAWNQARRGRLAHLAGTRLALAYEDAQPRKTLEYLLRTLQWYRRGAWRELTVVLVARAIDCAVRAQEASHLAALVWDMQQTVPSSLRGLQQQALAQAPAVETHESVHVVDQPPCTLCVHAVFARGTSACDEAMPFQVVVAIADDAPMDTLDVRQCDLYVSGQEAPLLTLAGIPTGPPGIVDVGDIVAGQAHTREVRPLVLSKREPLACYGRLQGRVPGMVAWRSVVCHVQRPPHTLKLETRIPTPSSTWLLPSGARLALPPRHRLHTLHVRAPTTEIHVPATVHAGQVVPLTVDGQGTLSVSDQAALLDEDGTAHASIAIPPHTLRLHAPSVTTPCDLELRCTTRARQTRRVIRVEPSFTVRAQDVPGARILHVTYHGAMPVCVERAHLNEAVLHGMDPQQVWTTHDRAVWAGIGAMTGPPTLVIEWRPCQEKAPPCVTHLALAVASPSPPLPVTCTVAVSTTHTTVLEPIHVDVRVHNTSDAVADLVLTVDETDDFGIDGFQGRLAVSMLLPQEHRTFPLTLWPKRPGPLVLPRVHAWDTKASEVRVDLTAPAIVHVASQ